MHYYKRNIGDYHKKAGRLTMLQHGAYTLLMDSCYDREEFPTLDMAIDWLWASTDAEVDAVKFVLNKFFMLESDVYTQNRIKEDLDKYHANSKTNKRIAIEREAKRKEGSTKRAPSVDESNTVEHEATPNHKPLTTNQEPLTSNQEPLKDLSATPPVKWNKKRFSDELINLGANPAHVADWMTTRGTFTETAFKSTISQAEKAGLTIAEVVKVSAESGWKGFKADYVKDRHVAPSRNAAAQTNTKEMDDWLNEPIDGEVISNQQGFIGHGQ